MEHPTTDRISDLYDAERMQVMRAIGLKPLSHHEANKLCYNGSTTFPSSRTRSSPAMLCRFRTDSSMKTFP